MLENVFITLTSAAAELLHFVFQLCRRGFLDRTAAFLRSLYSGMAGVKSNGTGECLKGCNDLEMFKNGQDGTKRFCIYFPEARIYIPYILETV